MVTPILEALNFLDKKHMLGNCIHGLSGLLNAFCKDMTVHRRVAACAFMLQGVWPAEVDLGEELSVILNVEKWRKMAQFIPEGMRF